MSDEIKTEQQAPEPTYQVITAFHGHFLAINNITCALECLQVDCAIVSPDCTLLPFKNYCVSPSGDLRVEKSRLHQEHDPFSDKFSAVLPDAKDSHSMSVHALDSMLPVKLPIKGG
jgi:hypothetical protein